MAGLTLTAISPTSISVSWDHPYCLNGIITGYTVYYRQTDTIQTSNINDAGFMKLNTTESQREVTLPDLVIFRNYTVHVRGMTSLLGMAKLELIRRTLSAPDPDPLIPPTPQVTDSPSSDRVVVLIADPRQIDTGRVM